MRQVFVPLMLVIATPASLPAQEHATHGAASHDSSMHAAMTGPLGISLNREGSGTSWLPDATSMYAWHWMKTPWLYMLHANVFAQYVDAGGDRGDDQFGSVNWVMGMARRKLDHGEFMARAMLSAERVTVTECGYPDLLSTGETCEGGRALHDRQHPHDLFMEIAASYERELTPDLALQLYGGPAGEPALGPAAFPHRLSALANPFAPIAHHWFDATHISFGVVTAGLFGRSWKLEGSVFNGREPDENRYDLDLDTLDSYSARLWILPNANWALQASVGRLKEAHPAHDGEPPGDITRPTASATWHRALSRGGMWASTAVWGRNDEEDERTDAFLIESNLNLAERHVLFMRAELVEKSGETLVLGEPALEQRIFEVSSVGVGYVRQFAPFSGFVPALGVSTTVSFVPRDLEPFYGSGSPATIAAFVSLRPKPMAMQSMQHGGGSR